jgi:hypothetical protein
LIVALGFFGISVSLDLFIPGDWLNWERELVLEDGSKLLGIMSWLAYFSRVCIGQLKQIMASPP